MISNYLPLVSIAQGIGIIGFSASTISGFILIILTLFGVRKIFGAYKYLMVVSTSLGIVLASLEMVLHPNLHFYNNGFVFFTLSKPFDLSSYGLEICLSLYIGVYSITISLLTVQFIYRYWTIFGLPYLIYFRGWKTSVWLIYCLFFGGAWSLGLYVTLKSDDVSKDYFQEEMLIRYDVAVDDSPMLTFVSFDPLTDSIRWRNCMYTVLITVILGFQYTTMMYCGWNIYSKMEHKIENFSVAMKHHHRQLFKTLVCQITAPTILLFSPLLFIICLPYFRVKLSFPACVIYSGFNIYPAIDSIIALYVVTEYRLAAKKMWNSFVKSNKIYQVRSEYETSTRTVGNAQLSSQRSRC